MFTPTSPFCFLCKLELLEFSIPLLHYIALNRLNPAVASLHRVCKEATAGETMKKVTVTWIFMWLVALAVRVLLVPVEDAAHKGRYQSHLGFGAGHSLSEWEEQRHVAVDAMFLLQLPATVSQQTDHCLIKEKDKEINTLYSTAVTWAKSKNKKAHSGQCRDAHIEAF